MFWEVGLLVLSLAAAISTHSVDVPQGESGMDATGALLNQTDPFRYLDAAGVPINDTESLMIFDEDVGFPKRNSIEERKGCSPTISCTRAGGYCIKARADCDGTVDTQGCRGGRKCKCCLPDQTTPAPSTCPTTQPIVTCPAVTCPAVTCPAVTPCPTTTAVTTEDQTTPAPSTCPTTQPIVICPIVRCPAVTPCPTTAVTTEGPTVNPNLVWLSVGSDRFVRIPQKINWFAARSLCQANGLDLYEPKDILGLSTYLTDNFSDSYYHLGGKGNGTHQVWLSGKVLTRSDPWYNSYYNNVGTNDCLSFLTYTDHSSRGTVLFASKNACTSRTSNGVICG